MEAVNVPLSPLFRRADGAGVVRRGACLSGITLSGIPQPRRQGQAQTFWSFQVWSAGHWQMQHSGLKGGTFWFRYTKKRLLLLQLDGFWSLCSGEVPPSAIHSKPFLDLPSWESWLWMVVTVLAMVSYKEGNCVVSSLEVFFKGTS